VSAAAWRRADRADIPALTAFLAAREERCAGFTGRLVKDGELRLPPVLRGAVWIRAERGAEPRAGAAPDGAAPTRGTAPPQGAAPLRGALLCHPSRLAFPILPDDVSSDRALALASGSWRPASAIGLAADVSRYEAALRLEAKAAVAYRLMARRLGSGAAPAAGRLPRDIRMRRALSSDLEALLPLQEAYEREEVLTPIHEFDEAACRASLARALERQLVLLAEEGGTAVAKAGTNARGLAVDQVGGVYTLPARRGRGLAAALVAALLAEIEGAGRSSSLFVKPHNAPAMSLYRGLGFVEIEDFRAAYYEK
jgi:uncharacterized protein